MEPEQGVEAAAVLDSIELTARKLGALLADSTMPDEVKEAWVALLPHMTLEQIDVLAGILEAKYLDEVTRPIDEEYKAKLERAVAEFTVQKAKEDEETLALLKRVKTVIDVL